jgi:hypothetical protein
MTTIGFDRAQSAYDHAEPDWRECDCDDDCRRGCECDDPRCLCGADRAEIEREYWAERRAEERRDERGWR